MDSGKRSGTKIATIVSAVGSVFVGVAGGIIIAAVFQSTEIICLLVISLPLISAVITILLLPVFHIELSQANEHSIYLGTLLGGFSEVLLSIFIFSRLFG